MIKLFKNVLFKIPVLTGFFIFLLILLITQFFTYQRYLLFKSIGQEEIRRHAYGVEKELQSVLNQGFNTTQTLAFIVENYGIPKNFDSIALLLLKTNNKINALELVNKQGIITHVYPLEGNEVIGFNILKDSIGKDGALETIERKNYFMTGPIRLKQGGSGFVSRTPIFNRNEFIGFTAAVIDLPTLLSAIPEDSLGKGRFSYQLSKVNPDYSEEVFFSSGDIAIDKAFNIPITTRKGEWKLYVISNSSSILSTIFIFGIVGFALSILAGTYVTFLLRQPLKLKKLVDEKTSLLNLSRRKYKTLIEQASDGIFITDLKGNIIDVNLVGLDMFGYDKEELLQKNLTDLSTPYELAKNTIKFTEIVKGNTVLNESKMFRKDGSAFFGEIKAKMLPNKTIQGIVRDSTERKKLELLAQNNLQKFSKAFNNNTVGMAILDLQQRFVDANTYFLNLIGWSLDEIKGKSINELDLITEAGVEKRDKAIVALELYGKIETMDIVFKTKSGNLLHLLTSAETYDFNNQKYILSTFIDRTEAKKAEKIIIESEEKYRLLVQNASDGIILMDPNANFIDVNIKICNMLGYSSKELLNMNVADVIDPENLKSVPLKFAELNAGKTIRTRRVLVKKDKTKVVVNANVKMLPNKTLQGIFRDVTEKEKALEQIAKSEKKYRELTERISDAFVAFDKDWTFIYINAMAAKIIAREPKELIGKNLWAEFPEFANSKAYPIFVDALENQKYTYFEQYHDEFDSWIANHLYPSKEGTTIYFKNITKQKLADQENQKLISIIENSQGFIGLANLNGKPLYLNEAGRKLVGIPSHVNINDFSILNIFQEDYKEVIKEEYIPQIVKKGSWHGETYLKNIQSDELVPMEFSAFLINDNTTHEPIGIGAVAFDLTERKEAEKEIVSLQNKMNAAIRIGKIGYWNWHVESGNIEWSDRMYEIYDVPLGTPITVAFTEKLVHPDDWVRHNEILAQKISSKDISPFTYRIAHKNLSCKHVLVQMEVVEDENNKPVWYQGTAVDITLTKEAEERLETQNLELKKTNSVLDSFVYSASHELRAPLTSVLGLVNIMVLDEKEPERLLQLRMMESSIMRLDDFIKDIIEYSKNRHLEVQLEKINFRTLIDDAFNSLWYLENTKKIKLVCNIENDTPFISDKKRIAVVLNNFISNAIKYHDLAKKQPSIWIHIKTTKKNATIEIRDNGLGIAKEHLDKIFNMFYRISSKVMGSGIGLYIVSEILEKLNGNIEVDSILKKGTSFVITLPNKSLKQKNGPEENSIDR
ncbi:PAS domain S-box protein [Maribacter sp. CXY002]|uniref:PAS domain S-box protein n=1 Tax=Maribacter luteocoastalis TaxID=3407671 RepID=UPI003B67140C